MKRLYFILVLWIGKFGNVLCKIFHKSGTMISGKVAVKLQKNFVKYFKNIDYDKVIFITGTMVNQQQLILLVIQLKWQVKRLRLIQRVQI